MEYTQVSPQYIHDERLQQPHILYRRDSGSDRLYYSCINGTVMKYPSVTTIVGKTTAMPEYLLKWIADYGFRKAEEIKQQSADYGTLMHISIARYLINKRFDVQSIPMVIDSYKREHNIQYDTRSWSERLLMDVLAFHQFCLNYNVHVLALEIPLLMTTPEGYNVAGTVDMICTMTIQEKGFFGDVYKSGEKKGTPKQTATSRRVTAIVDFKSGRHGFSESHEIQLGMYRMLVSANFPSLQVEKLYNWSPKNWNDAPSYHLKDQSEVSYNEVMCHIFKYYERHSQSAPERLYIESPIIFGEPLHGLKKVSVLNDIKELFTEKVIKEQGQPEKQVDALASKEEFLSTIF